MMLSRPAAAVLLLALSTPHVAQAHFAWLATDDDGHAIFFFGESIADRTYHLPDKMADAIVEQWGEDGSYVVPMTKIKSDTFIGRRSARKTRDSITLTCTKAYGIYQGSKLTYHSQHVAGAPDQWNQAPNKQLAFQALIAPREQGGVLVQVLLNNEPLVGAKVQLFSEDGHEESVATTDEKGQVEFGETQVQEGLNGLLVGHVDKNSTGDFAGTEFSGEAHYLTVTFRR